MDVQDTSLVRPQTLRSSPSGGSSATRYRSPSAKSAVASRAAKHAAPSQEVISSLIQSLSAISGPIEEHFENLPDLDENTLEHQYEGQASSQSPVRHNAFETEHIVYSNIEEQEQWQGDDGVAESPVVRMAPQRRSSKTPDQTNGMLRLQASQSSIRAGDAFHNQRTLHEGDIFGMPSIEIGRPLSRASLASSRPGTSGQGIQNGEVLAERTTALTNASVNRSGGFFDGPARFLGSKGSRGSLNREDAGQSPSLLRRPASILRLNTTPNPSTSLRNSTNSISLGRNVGLLNDHLIPSRRSSLRHSIHGSTRDTKRPSSDLTELNIHQDLIEQDHSTVKRIRELQEAKEQREQEWRSEARKSERSKRNSLPNPRILHRSNSHHSGRFSVAAAIVETPDTGENSRTVKNATSAESITSQDHEPEVAVLLAERFRKTATPPSTTASHPNLPTPQSSLNRPHIRKLSNGFGKPKITLGDASGIYPGPIDAEVTTFLESPRLRQQVRHPHTGRIISFSEVGDPKGFAVVCCVGMGLTRYLTTFYDDLARTMRLRLITPDRPGIGGSDPNPTGTPLNWTEDLTIICDALGIEKFSLLAHSAGAIYALATALTTPHRVRGRIHLLAPWIPPSQLVNDLNNTAAPATSIPFSQRLLSVLPTAFLKAANASFMSAASASVTKSPKPRIKRNGFVNGTSAAPGPAPSTSHGSDQSTHSVSSPSKAVSCYQATSEHLAEEGIIPSLQTAQTPFEPPTTLTPPVQPPAFNRSSTTSALSPEARQQLYDSALTSRVWELTVKNANPSVDLVVCFEKRQPIGFRYSEITRSVVLHHGSRDTRVPIENVKWLASTMKRCEFRILEGEGHGLMASANVMASVLSEVATEWEEWKDVVDGKAKRQKSRERW